jgi:hypothetical protein
MLTHETPTLKEVYNATHTDNAVCVFYKGQKTRSCKTSNLRDRDLNYCQTITKNRYAS